MTPTIKPAKTVVATAKNSITHSGKTIYLNNRELLAAVHQSKTKGQMSDTLAKMLQLLCSKYAKKGNFVNYSYNDDMQSYAMLMLVRTWNSFNPEKSNNPFAFFTQCIKNSFIQYLNQEKRQRVIRDEMLVDQGMSPSHGFSESGRTSGSLDDDEQDFDIIQSQADMLKKADFEEAPIIRDETGKVIDIPIELTEEGV
jgi:RNA polymerase sigma factor (sigma-70 family)